MIDFEFNAGDISEIRRCKTIEDVMLTPAFYRVPFEPNISREKKAIFLLVISRLKTGTSDLSKFLASDDYKEVRLKKLLNSSNDMQLCKNIIRACRIGKDISKESIYDFIKYFPGYNNKAGKVRLASRIYEERFAPKKQQEE